MGLQPLDVASGASVLIAMVFHAMNNSVSGEYFSQMFDGDDSIRQSWMLVIVWSAAATLVVLFGRGFRRAQAVPSHNDGSRAVELDPPRQR